MKDDFLKIKIDGFLEFEKALISLCQGTNSLHRKLNEENIPDKGLQLEIGEIVNKLNNSYLHYSTIKNKTANTLKSHLTMTYGDGYLSNLDSLLLLGIDRKYIASVLILLEVLFQEELNLVFKKLVFIFMSFKEELTGESYIKEVFVPKFIHEPIVNHFFHYSFQSLNLVPLTEAVLDYFQNGPKNNDLIGMGIKSLHLIPKSAQLIKVLNKASLNQSLEIRDEAKKLLNTFL